MSPPAASKAHGTAALQGEDIPMSAMGPPPEPLAARAREALVEAPVHEPVASPCINVCRLTEDHGHCQGCFRTVDEIRAWSRAGAQERRRIWCDLLRRAGLEAP